jgi:hypothetical protein
LRRLRLAGQVVKVRIAEPGSMIVVLAIDDRVPGRRGTGRPACR